MSELFDENKLRQEIVRVWGGYGVHADVYDALGARVKELEAGNQAAMDAGYAEGVMATEARAIKRIDELEKKLAEAKDFAMKYCAPHFQEYMHRLEEENKELKAALQGRTVSCVCNIGKNK